MMKRELLNQDLREVFPFLAGEGNGFVERFLGAATGVHLAAGQPVCHQGDLCAALPLLLKGSARVYTSGDTGREITLYRLGRGESCVLTASCILSARPFPAIAVCESEVHAVLVPAPQVRDWLAQAPAWREFVFGLVAERLHRIIGVVEDVVFLRLDQRLAEYLLNRSPDPEDGCLYLTHQRIADDLGSSREVVSRLLKDFEHQRWVSVGRGKLCIENEQGLRRLCASGTQSRNPMT